MPFVKRHRDYYKYGTELDASIVGNFARLDKGVASGFSTSQYLTLPNTFKPEGNSWEICFKVHTPSSHTDEAIFSKYTSDTYYGLRLELTTSGKIYYLVSATSGANHLFEGTGTNTIPTDADVLIKFQFTGTKYIGQISNDNGETWITDKEYDSTTKMYDWNSASTIGYFAGKGTHFKGSIDLSQSYININGERWWSGDSYTKVGSWIEEGVVSGFNASNCLIVPKNLPDTISSSEYVFKILTGSSVSSPENQIMHAHQSPNTWCVAVRGGVLQVFNGSWNSTSTTVLPNTEYFVKSVFNGSSWILYSSADGVIWKEDFVWNTTTSYAGTNLYIGRDYDTTGEYFSGTIDLTQSYIKINGKEWWHGTKAVLSTEADADYHVDSNKLYHLTAFNRTYYKYVWENWTQPVLTANGTLGGDSFAVGASSYQSTGSFEPWKAFDNISEYEDYNAWLSGTTTMPVYFVFYNPKPLKVKKLSIKNFAHRNNPNYIIGSGEVLGSNNNTDWVLLKTFTNTIGGGGEVWDIDLSTNEQGFKYYKINITSSLNTNGDVGIGELTITAQELEAIGGVKEDADYYTDKIITYTPMSSKTKYYKYTYQDWEQPVLTENGTVGGDKFAVVASSEYANTHYAYMAFNSVTNDYWHSNSGLPQWISWYNPNPLKMINVNVTNRYHDGSYPNAYQLQYSDDNSTWVTAVSGNGTSGDSVSWDIPVEHDTFHRYWRLYVTSASGSNSSYVAIGEIVITAQEQIPVESTSSDYDYYVRQETKMY